MTIYDGGSITSPMIGKYCGASIPPSHVSSSNEILVHFFSNGGGALEAGFKMEYNPIGKIHQFESIMITIVVVCQQMNQDFIARRDVAGWN